MMQKIKVTTHYDASVLQIRLNDGKGNVLDYQMMEEIQEVLNQCKNKPELKLICFSGEGKHFSFGASVEEHTRELAPAMLKNFHGLFFTLRELSIPTLCLVSGQCLGGGMELAIMCNIIFADKTSKWGQPEISLGVFPPPASILLPLKIGYARAEELLISGRSISGTEAQHLGLVNFLAEDKTEMEKMCFEYIEKNIIPKSASSLRFGVKAARIKFNHILGNFLPQLENIYLSQLMHTKDANEGILSFIEKRNPVWENN